MNVQTLTIKKPFDSHVHFRQGAMLRAVVPCTAAHWSGAIVMPNTAPPIETVEQAVEYKKEVLAAVPEGQSFEPLMTLYLTKNLTPEEIEKTAGSSVYAAKSYPYGATTNSQWGYASVLDAKEVLKKMEEVGMPLLLHGEVHTDESGNEVDPYEGEKVFVTEVLPRLLETYPKLKVSLEHLSTTAAADFIEKNGKEKQLVATITPHHLMYDRTHASGEHAALLTCKPILKEPEDRAAIRALAAKGLPFISAGTDSAPHPESKKRGPKPAFGVFSAPVAVELYTQVFDELGALDPLDGFDKLTAGKLGASKLENFLSMNGPRFFGIEPSKETLMLEKKDWQLSKPVMTDEGEKVWSLQGETIHWQVSSS